MGRTAKRSTSGADSADHRTEGTAASRLLSGHPRYHPQLSQSRNLVHGLDFNSPQAYNGATPGNGGDENSEPLRREWHLISEAGEQSGGNKVDPQLKQLMKELGDAINESLSDSEQISEVVSRIKEGGYDIFLVLEATIGVSKQGEKSSDKTSLVTTLSTNPEFKINDQDLKFLKSLRIKIDEDKHDPGTTDKGK